MNPRSVRHDSGQQTLARSLAKQDNPRRLTECERACKTRGTEKRWREPSARRVQRGRGAVPGLLTLVPKHLSSAVQRPLELVLVVRHHLDFDDINCTAGETARGDQRNFSQSSSYGRPSLTRSRDCRRGQARHSGGCKVRREAFRKCVWKLVHQAACGRTGRRGGVQPRGPRASETGADSGRLQVLGLVVRSQLGACQNARSYCRRPDRPVQASQAALLVPDGRDVVRERACRVGRLHPHFQLRNTEVW